MNQIDKLTNWFRKFKKYIVTYKDGFFQLVSITNSPEAVIESFSNMRFCQIDRDKRLLTSNTPFVNAQVYYLELEEGLWVLVSDLYFKKNVTVTTIHEKEVPAEYNTLNLQFYETTIKHKSTLISGVVVSDKSWLLFKAGKVSAVHYFKDTHRRNIGVYFTNEWLNRQLKEYQLPGQVLNDFFESTNDHILWQDRDLKDNALYKTFLDKISLHTSTSNTEIHALVLNLFRRFIDRHRQEVTSENYFKLSDQDYKNVQKAEKFLLDNLLTSFPGIEKTAALAGVSATKLKADFKIIHQQSLYQYYRYHQMNLAHTLFTQKKTTVKEVANLLGYSNASKFTAAFKDQYGVLPSDIGN